MTKSQLELKFKTLRKQMDDLEAKCKKREDAMLRVLLALEPFVEVLTDAQQKEMLASAEMKLDL